MKCLLGNEHESTSNEPSPGVCGVGTRRLRLPHKQHLRLRAAQPGSKAQQEPVAHEIATPIAEEGNLSNTPSSSCQQKSTRALGDTTALHRGFPAESKEETPRTETARGPLIPKAVAQGGDWGGLAGLSSTLEDHINNGKFLTSKRGQGTAHSTPQASPANP